MWIRSKLKVYDQNVNNIHNYLLSDLFCKKISNFYCIQKDIFHFNRRTICGKILPTQKSMGLIKQHKTYWFVSTAPSVCQSSQLESVPATWPSDWQLLWSRLHPGDWLSTFGDWQLSSAVWVTRLHAGGWLFTSGKLTARLASFGENQLPSTKLLPPVSAGLVVSGTRKDDIKWWIPNGWILPSVGVNTWRVSCQQGYLV